MHGLAIATVSLPTKHLKSLSLSVCPVLSVMLVYCGQTVERVKMKLCMQLVLGPALPYSVRWGPSSPRPKGGRSPPIFGPYLLRPNGCIGIKIPLGMEVGLGTGDFVLDGWVSSFLTAHQRIIRHSVP